MEQLPHLHLVSDICIVHSSALHMVTGSCDQLLALTLTLGLSSFVW